MRPRFDSYPLVTRRRYTGTIRSPVALGWKTQLQHGAHLFFVIAASIIARNVANQQVLDAVGPKVLGKLYLSVALIAGFGLAAFGWWSGRQDTRRVCRAVHAGAALLMLLCFVTPPGFAGVVVVKYVLMEIAFAALLLAFGVTLGASLGPREARRVAARIGAGGIIGGLVGGVVLSLGAWAVGSRAHFLVAALFALAPVFWFPTATVKARGTTRVDLSREHEQTPGLAPYGLWVALTTVAMVGTTTLIDYQFRYAATRYFSADAMTAFFGFVVLLAGVITLVFQVSFLDRVLDRLGLFSTAVVMPAGLLVASLAFGLLPTLTTLVLLKLVDSGANMSVQQATGGLLLAPLSPRARAVWQSRIDGLAKRGGQALAGVVVSLFPLAPDRVLPVTVLFCLAWAGAIWVTRKRYVRLLTELLTQPSSREPEISAYDGATVRLLEAELAKASPERAAVVLELLEQVEHRAPDPLLRRLVDSDPGGASALRVVEHLSVLGDGPGLQRFAADRDPRLAGAALLALSDLKPTAAEYLCLQILRDSAPAESLRAVAAGLASHRDDTALALCQELARAPSAATRLALAQALGKAEAGARAEIGALIVGLAADPDVQVARSALAALARHPSDAACSAALRALRRRELRGAAMHALADLGPPAVANLSRELARALGEPEVAAALTWALGRIGTAGTVPALLSALKAEDVGVRLSTAVALTTVRRRRGSLDLGHEELSAFCERELDYYARVREAGACRFPETPAAQVLRRTLRQRSQASLETLFRLLALYYPEDTIQGAFGAFLAGGVRERQLALELLDAVLDKSLSQALARAVGERPAGYGARGPAEVARGLTESTDGFVAMLARSVLLGLGEVPSAHEGASAPGGPMAQVQVDQILELQSLALFNHASAEDLAEVAALVSARAAPKGASIFREGDVPDAIYLIRSGQVTLSRAKKVIGALGPGDAFGIVAVLDGRPREMSVTTTSDCVLLALKADDLLQLLVDRPLLMHSVFRALTGAIRSQLDQIAIGKKADT